MVAAPGETRIGALSTESARQRFNVAVSRAQDQLWLFHTATLDVLSDTCMRYRLLRYMLDPARQATNEREQVFDSEFERHVYRIITDRGFHVRTQVCVGDPTNHRYRIDLVVEGMQGRLAVECDGDTWHGAERYEHDMARQRDLERAGWQFIRIRGGNFYRNSETAMEPVWVELDRLGIRPGGVDIAASQPPEPICIDSNGAGVELVTVPSASENSPTRDEMNSSSLPTEDETELVQSNDDLSRRTPTASEQRQLKPATAETSSEQPDLFSQPPQSSAYIGSRARYFAFEGQAGPDPRLASPAKVAEGLEKIIQIEGPMLAKRAYDIYLRGCGIRRMGGELKSSMNKALQQFVSNGQVIKEDETGKGGFMHTIVRSAGASPVLLRERGPREFEEIPPSELQLIARKLLRDGEFESGSDAHLRAILDFYELKRLTAQVGTTLLDALGRKFPYVEDLIVRDNE